MRKLAQIATVLAVAIAAFGRQDVAANPVDTNTAKLVATNFLQQHDATVKSVAQMRVSQVAVDNGLSNLYIVERTDRAGFVVISADDCVQPVLAYSTTSVAGMEIPVNAMDWFRGYNGEIAYCVANNIQATEEVRAAWQHLTEQSDASPRGNVFEEPLQTHSGTPVVGPLVSTTWDQAPLYNNLCPYDNTYGDRTVVGCVATAMAQIMKYWNHPLRGTGSKSYYAQNQSQTVTYGTLSANFAATTYDWANMPTALTAQSSSAEVNAVATLSYHCGVAVEMMYGVSSQGGSGAYTTGNYSPTAEWALKTYFGYKSSLASVYRDNMTDAQWNSLLKRELDARRPLLHSGRGNGGGHAFVCDGYDNTGKFHYNWGWSGSYNGFFESNNLAPAGGGIGTNNSNTFNLYQAVVYGIEPNNPSLTVRTESLLMASSGDSQIIRVFTSNDTHRWTAVASKPWLTLSATSGTGAGNVHNISVNALANNSGTNRTAKIMIVQNSDTAIVTVVQPCGNHSISGRYGNTSTNYIQILDTLTEIVLRPEKYGAFAAGDTVKAVYFTTYYHPQYPDFSDTVFTITIYENPTYTDTLMSGKWDLATNVLGTPRYTQTFTQLEYGQQVVPLNTPYVIKGNTFWVGLKVRNGALLRFFSESIGDSVLLSNYPIADSIAGNYLDVRDGYARAAIMGNIANDTNYAYQFNKYYTFSIDVATDATPTVAIMARPDSIHHGYITGTGIYGLGDTATIVAHGMSGYSFSHWNDGVTANTRTFVVCDTVLYPELVAYYDVLTPVTLSVTSANAQFGTTYGSGTYFAGDTVVAIAIPADSTKYFMRWNDNNSSNPRRFVINANTQFVAYFATRNVVTVHDTIHDTAYVNVPVHDTTYINVAVHDTIHDTAYISLPQHNFNITSANNAQGVTVGTGTYPQGLRIGIAAVPGEGYRFSHWSDNNTDNPRHFTVSGDVSLTAYFTACTGLNNPDKSFSVEVYPNPTTSFVTLSQYAERVEVLDNVGRTVAVAESVINLDLSDLAPGTYTLRISANGAVAIRKVVKR